MPRIVISDTSCLIAFQRIGRLDLLQKLFSKVTVTIQVKQEFGYPLPDWVVVQPVANPDRLSTLKSLDLGEASSITLAIENPNAVLIIDEKKGRSIARGLGVEILGTLRILLLAKEKKIIPAVKEIVLMLHEEGFRFSQRIIEELLTEADEM